MKAFVIGDIHGQFNEFMELIKDIDRSKTLIISVGDMIDRGPDSRKVINYIRDNNILVVQGNHELMAADILDSVQDDFYPAIYGSNWLYNGGDIVYEQYDNKEDLITDLEWMSKLPLFIKTNIKNSKGQELIVSHTYCLHTKLEKPNKKIFSWTRTQPYNKGSIESNKNLFNIYGHTNVINGSTPNIYSNACNVDTGCVYKNIPSRGVLSGVFFPSMEIKQVKSK